MAPTWVDQKRRYRHYKARTKQLPAGHRMAIEALERYMEHFGPGTGDGVLSMLEDLADLFDESVANGSSVRDVVGDDPVEFAEAFLRNYPEGSWVRREQDRLTTAVGRAEAQGADDGKEDPR
jgi:DNA-binding ferritin-like protein (Dps family)